MEIRITINDRSVELLGALRRRLTRRRLAAAALTLGLLSTWVAVAAPIDKPFHFSPDTVISASEINANFDALYDEINAGSTIRAGTTIPVAGNCDALRDALDSLDGRRIRGGVDVILQLEAATYDCDQPLLLRHPDGDRIRIFGDDSGSTVLTFSGNGLVVAGARAFGSIRNVTIDGSAVDAPGSNGISVLESSAIGGMGLVTVRGFEASGILVQGGSNIIGDGITLEDNDTGLLVERTSSASVRNVIATDNATAGIWARGSSWVGAGIPQSSGSNYGFLASEASHMYLENAIATANRVGLSGGSGATLTASNPTVTESERFSIHADWRANIIVYGDVETGGGEYRYVVSKGGFISRVANFEPDNDGIAPADTNVTPTNVQGTIDGINPFP